ncbi:MAG: 50S ribosomal protein L15 [Pirellulales bacterium]|nr:50S ribosomal protein L15 [Pirellulales bacterium]
MILNDVHRGITRHKKRRRLGRGIGSGQGKTAGRGHKGQRSRAGSSSHPTFQGGTMPLVRRVPKRGFNNRWRKTLAVVNVGQIEAAFEVGEEVTMEALAAKNLAKGRYDLLKVLGEGEFSKKITVSAHRFSKTAIEKIEKAGGKVVILPGKTTVTQKNHEKTQSTSS